MKVLLVCLLFVGILVSLSSASCKNRRLKYMTHKWSSKITFYCKYRGRKYGIGSQFTDIQRCKKCECTMSGLSCCGIGYYAGVQVVPGCAVVPDRCHTAILNLQKTGLCTQTV